MGKVPGARLATSMLARFGGLTHWRKQTVLGSPLYSYSGPCICLLTGEIVQIPDVNGDLWPEECSIGSREVYTACSKRHTG